MAPLPHLDPSFSLARIGKHLPAATQGEERVREV
jgi:hypothetical protein